MIIRLSYNSNKAAGSAPIHINTSSCAEVHSSSTLHRFGFKNISSFKSVLNINSTSFEWFSELLNNIIVLKNWAGWLIRQDYSFAMQSRAFMWIMLCTLVSRTFDMLTHIVENISNFCRNSIYTFLYLWVYTCYEWKKNTSAWQSLKLSICFHAIHVK